MYSWLTSINSSIICVRYSLLINGLEMPIVNGAPSAAGWVPGASVAGDSVAGISVAGISVAGASVAGASVAGGASVVGAAQAVIMDRMVIITVTSKTNFLLFSDISSSPIIFGYSSTTDSANYLMIYVDHLLAFRYEMCIVFNDEQVIKRH